MKITSFERPSDLKQIYAAVQSNPMSIRIEMCAVGSLCFEILQQWCGINTFFIIHGNSWLLFTDISEDIEQTKNLNQKTSFAFFLVFH